MRFLVLTVIFLVASCNHQDENGLIQQQVFDGKEKLIQEFYLNKNNQKDSIENIYSRGKLTRQIFWKNGEIDSVSNYKNSNIISYEIISDSISKVFNLNKELIAKIQVDENGAYYGTGIHYQDSVISRIKQYKQGNTEGLFVNFNKEEYPTLIGSLEDNSFRFGVVFYPNHVIKSLRINLKNSKLGVLNEYYNNGSLKSKSELKNGIVHGFQYEFDSNNEVISKTQFNMGKIVIEDGLFISDEKD